MIVCFDFFLDLLEIYVKKKVLWYVGKDWQEVNERNAILHAGFLEDGVQYPYQIFILEGNHLKLSIRAQITP